MGLLILERRPRAPSGITRFLVECPECHDRYVTSGYRGALERVARCKGCENASRCKRAENGTCQCKAHPASASLAG